VVKDGNKIGVSDGYFLVRTNPDAGINDPIESLDDLQLVPQNAANPGLVDTLWLGSDALVFYQVLSDDSRVVAAINEAQQTYFSCKTATKINQRLSRIHFR
jgi:hypothetical protein